MKIGFMILMSLSLSAFASWKVEKEKIDYLINKVEKSNATFIRNGESHNSKKAAKHLRTKLKNALSSWFTPKKKDWNVRLFIDEVASHSSWSGKPYLIKLKSGETIEAKKWFNQQLQLKTKN